MARMKKIPLETIRESGKRLTVGNNRQIQWFAAAGIFSGFLHGFEVFQYAPDENKVTLDPCGFPTVTTRRKMKNCIRLIVRNFSQGMATNYLIAKSLKSFSMMKN